MVSVASATGTSGVRPNFGQESFLAAHADPPSILPILALGVLVVPLGVVLVVVR